MNRHCNHGSVSDDQLLCLPGATLAHADEADRLLPLIGTKPTIANLTIWRVSCQPTRWSRLSWGYSEFFTLSITQRTAGIGANTLKDKSIAL
ncbi:Uncharacterized protein HZ326_10401 [Fusarium oxysporum f. sp. albedinis]|nr:Uncharacterized protein HZ326_10401 [Fusarium oxysporum f. sp. albedinis]